jgi:hypothetical protein
MPRGVSRLDEAQLQGRLWTPALLPSLALWLDAGDLSTISIATGVSQWRDKSGNERHFAQTTAGSQPLYRQAGFNGRPCLENVSADTLTIGSSGLGRDVAAITCAIVGSHPAGITFAANATEISIAVGTSAQARFSMSANPNSTNKYGHSSRRLDTDGSVSFPSSTDSLPNRGNPWIRIAQRVYSSGVGNHWTNGIQDMIALAGGTSGNTSNTNSTTGSIFATTPNGTKLSEIVLTHSQLVQREIELLEGYLAWHWWGDVNTLLATHRFRNRPPLIGD